jgi:hypothetical protein
MHVLQFQKGLSEPVFLQFYGTEASVRKLLLRNAGPTVFNVLAATGLSMASCSDKDQALKKTAMRLDQFHGKISNHYKYQFSTLCVVLLKAN